MNENRRQILEMLAAGKITAEEAERLLAALDPEPVAWAPGIAGPPRTATDIGESGSEVSARAGGS